MSSVISKPLQAAAVECSKELESISEWWLENVIDFENDGFIGRVDDSNQPDHGAHKSAVYSTRLLWFFSEVARLTGRRECARAAELVYRYLLKHFVDDRYGGIYWELDSRGEVVSPRKQVYAQAFFIYGLCAYYRLTADHEALSRATDVYRLLEDKAHDHKKLGYLESLNREWGPQDDLRLSKKEPNLPKTMNTHLHVLEAYTSLHSVAAGQETGRSLQRILGYFTERIFNDESRHLRLFFDEDWNDKSTGYSYGHDIECSWLMWEAAEVLADAETQNQVKALVSAIAETCLKEGMGTHGELLDGFDFAGQKTVFERIWWVQGEALVGYLNAYELTGREEFAEAFLGMWEFIKEYQRNNQYGEWCWFSRLDLEEHKQFYKAGFWKGPYHSGRAMMEVSRRLSNVSKKLYT